MKKLGLIFAIIYLYTIDNLSSMNQLQTDLTKLKGSTENLKKTLQLLNNKLRQLNSTLEKSARIKAYNTILTEFHKICIEPRPGGGFKQASSTNFNKNFIDSLDEKTLKTAFPHLGKKQIIKNFINNLFDIYTATIKEHNLSWCLCIDGPISKRFFLILCQINAVLEKYPDQNNMIVHLELGEEGGMQSYLLAQAFRLIGYNHFHLVAINVIYCKGYATLKTKIEALAHDFTVTTYHAQEGKKVDSTVYQTYIDDLKTQKEPKVHSIGVTDPSGSEGAIMSELTKLLKEDVTVDNNAIIYELINTIKRYIK